MALRRFNAGGKKQKELTEEQQSENDWYFQDWYFEKSSRETSRKRLRPFENFREPSRTAFENFRDRSSFSSILVMLLQNASFENISLLRIRGTEARD